VLKWIVLVVAMILAVVGLIELWGSRLSPQHTASRTIALRQTPEQVWDVIAGPPTWRPEVTRYELLSADPHRTWIEYGRHGQKLTYEFVSSDPPHRLVTRLADPHLPFGGSWTYEITSTSTGSSLTITENGEIYNPVFRFVARYVQGYTATLDNYLSALKTKLNAA